MSKNGSNLNINIVATDKASPAVDRIAKLISSKMTAALGSYTQANNMNQGSQKALVNSINSSNLSLRAKQKILKSVNNEMVNYNAVSQKVNAAQARIAASNDPISNGFIKTNQNLKKMKESASGAAEMYRTLAKKQTHVATGNAQLNKSIGVLQQSSNIINTTVKSLLLLESVLRKVLSLLVLFVGKEAVFKMINKEASILGITIGRLANYIESTAGPFAKLAPILKILSTFLKSNNSAFILFNLVSAGSINQADQLRESLLGTAGASLNLRQKLRLAEQGLSIYSKALWETGSNVDKLKSALYGTASVMAGLTATLLDDLSRLASAGAIFVASILGIAVIDKVFFKVIKGIDSLEKALIRINFRQDDLLTSLHQSKNVDFFGRKAFTNMESAFQRAYKRIIKLSAVAYGRISTIVTKSMSSIYKSSDQLSQTDLFSSINRSVGAMQTRFSMLEKIANKVQYAIFDLSSGFHKSMKSQYEWTLKLSKSLVSLKWDVTSLANNGYSILNKNLPRTVKSIKEVAKNAKLSIEIFKKLSQVVKIGAVNPQLSNEMFELTVTATNAARVISQTLIGSLMALSKSVAGLGLNILGESFNKLGLDIYKAGNALVGFHKTLIKGGSLLPNGSSAYKFLTSNIKTLGKSYIETTESAQKFGFILGDLATDAIGYKVIRLSKFFTIFRGRLVDTAVSIASLSSNLIRGRVNVDDFTNVAIKLSKVLKTSIGFLYILGGSAKHLSEVFNKILLASMGNIYSGVLTLIDGFKLLPKTLSLASNDILNLISKQKNLKKVLGLSAASAKTWSKNIQTSYGAIAKNTTLLRASMNLLYNSTLEIARGVSIMSTVIGMKLTNSVFKSIDSLWTLGEAGLHSIRSMTVKLPELIKSTANLNKVYKGTIKIFKLNAQAAGGFAEAIKAQLPLMERISTSLSVMAINAKDYAVNFIKSFETEPIGKYYSTLKTASSAALSSVSASLKNVYLDMSNIYNNYGGWSSFFNYISMRAEQAFLVVGKLAVKGMIKSLQVLKKSLLSVRSTLQVIAQRQDLMQMFSIKNITAASKSFQRYATGAKEISKITLEGIKHTEFFHKSIGGLASKATALSGVFGSLGLSMISSDKIMVKLSGVTLLALGAAFGGLSYIIHRAFLLAGESIQHFGDYLSELSDKQAEAFGHAQKYSYAFTYVMKSYADSTKEAAENTKRWSKYIEETSDATGASISTLQSLVAETVSVTESFHLNEDQMKALINRSVDLAETYHQKPMAALSAMLKAMQGNTQGLITYGMHLNEHAVKVSNISEEYKNNYSTLDRASKAQANYGVLMEQAAKSADFAKNNTDTYSKSIEIQEKNVKNLMASMGKGASIINGEYNFAIAKGAKALTDFAKPILPTIGFIQSLGAKLLQITGFILKNALMVGFLTSSYHALNAVLAGLSAKGFFSGMIGNSNTSLKMLIVRLGATNGEIKSLGQAFKATFQILKTQILKSIPSLAQVKTNISSLGLLFKKQAASMTRSMLGINAATKLTARSVGVGLNSKIKELGLSMLGIKSASGGVSKGFMSAFGGRSKKAISIMSTGFVGLSAGIKSVTLGLYSAAKASLVFLASNPILLGVVAAVASLVVAFKYLEEETSILSEAWGSMKSVMVDDTGIFSAVGETLSALGKKLASIYGAFFHVMMAGWLQVAGLWLRGLKIILKIASVVENLSGSSSHNADAMLLKVDSSLNRLNNDSKKYLKQGGAGLLSLFVGTAKAGEVLGVNLNKISTAQMRKEFNSAKEASKKAFEDMANYMPHASFEKFTKEITQTENNLNKLAENSKSYKLRLIEEGKDVKEIAKVEAVYRKSIEGLKAIKIKKMEEAKSAKIQSLEIELKTKRLMQYSFEDDEKQRRLEFSKEMYNKSVEQEYRKILKVRNLEKASQGMSLTIKEKAILKANDFELKTFKETLDRKNKLAVNKELEKQMMLAANKASVLQGGNSGASADAEMQLALIKEQQKKDMITKANLWSEAQEASHQQRLRDIKVTAQTARAKEELDLANNLKTLLGDTPEGRAAEIEAQTLQDQLELENLRVKYQNRSDLEALIIAKQADQQMKLGQKMIDYKKDRRKEELNDIIAMATFKRQMGEKEYKEYIKNLDRKKLASALFHSQKVRDSLKTFTNMNDMGAVFGKKGFELAKKASMATNIIKTYESATNAYASLSAIPFVGPALGAAAAAAAIVAGMANQKRIAATKYQAQAHGGMDKVPQSLNNKTFVLKAGERVVQPEANKDLTEFLKGGGSGKGETNINITINGNPDESQLASLKAHIIDAIRESSERGEPIINEKGIVRT